MRKNTHNLMLLSAKIFSWLSEVHKKQENPFLKKLESKTINNTPSLL